MTPDDNPRPWSGSRRDFVRTTALGGAALTGATSLGAPSFQTGAPRAGVLPITIAGYRFDCVDALADGRVGVDGCSVTFDVSTIGDMNADALGGPMTREVTEIGLSPYMLAVANDRLRDHTLIPVFPLRQFRHKSIYIRPDRGIESPADLRGCRVATAGYSSTSLTWIRGILQEEYGVKPEDLRWVVSTRDSSTDASGAASRNEQLVPDGLSVETGPAGKDESDMLVDGDVDALFHAAEPRAFRDGDPNCVPLFADSRHAERDYYRRTGVFPIMHAVAMRLDVVEQHPWLPEAIFTAYGESKRRAYSAMTSLGWATEMLPWYSQELRETISLMGANFWPYGIEPNRVALETLFRYSFEQGLCRRKLTIEELFHPSTLHLLDVAT